MGYLWRKGEQWLLVLLMVFIPSNLFLKFFENTAYVSGLQIDYLIPKLYLADILAGSFVLLWYWNRRQRFSLKQVRQSVQSWIKTNSVLATGLLTLCVLQLFSAAPLSSLWYLAHIWLAVAVFAAAQHTQLSQKTVLLGLTLGLSLQTHIAILQWLLQSAVFPYHVLGETNLNIYSGIAQAVWNGVEYIAPYGTTPHPNILAGITTIYSIFLAHLLNSQKWRTYLVFIFPIVLIILTQSVSAALCLGIYLIMTQSKLPQQLSVQKLISILMIGITAFTVGLQLLNSVYPDQTSLNRRTYLNQASLEILSDHLLTGTGLNAITTLIEEYTYDEEPARFAQPIHNVPLLLITELGVVGTGLLGYSMRNRVNRKKDVSKRLYLSILALTPLLALDHYLVSYTPFFFLYAIGVSRLCLGQEE